MDGIVLANNILGAGIAVVVVLLSSLALAKLVAWWKEGRRVDVEPVGVNKDLPESVTGIHKDK